MSREHLHFVTGRLAEPALREVVAQIAPVLDCDCTLEVLPITVAALMTPDWIARHWQPPSTATRILLPGYCGGDLTALAAAAPSAVVERGPRDLRQLPEFFGQSAPIADYGRYDIEILAEINHAPRLAPAEILRQARALAAAGADVIDVGCDPGEPWSGAGECVRMLRGEGLRVSIDSLNPAEIAPAVKAGAELVLSVNGSNRSAAPDWGCEVTVIPDDPESLAGLDETAAFLAERNVPFRLDPILSPIGLGFFASLARYAQVRARYPTAAMLMGIGNVTELTDVDSAGVNVLLLAICQELGIGSVLTTQVINWAQSSVAECDLARRLVWLAVTGQVPPKRIDERLVMLRDPRVFEHGREALDRLAQQITDGNFRLFAEQQTLHAVTAGMHLEDADPYLLFEKMQAAARREVDPAHAFYLGYELCKAITALTLGKQYRQDEALDWGFLTRPEVSHRDRKRRPESS